MTHSYQGFIYTVKTSHSQTGLTTGWTTGCIVWTNIQLDEYLFTRCSRLFNRGCQTAQAVEQPVGHPIECLYTLNVCIHETAGCPTGCQTGDDLTRDVLTMEGRFDWDVMTLGRFDDGTFWQRDVLTVKQMLYTGDVSCNTNPRPNTNPITPILVAVRNVITQLLKAVY